MKLITLIFAIFFIASTRGATNYCQVCTNHVACNNNGLFVSSCPKDASIVPMSTSAISTFLNAHNANRNKIAGGGEPGFKTATKMLKMVRNLKFQIFLI